MSAFFAAKAVYVRLSEITITGFVIPKIMRYAAAAPTTTTTPPSHHHHRVSSVARKRLWLTFLPSCVCVCGVAYAAGLRVPDP